MKNSKIDPAQKAALEIIKKVRAGEYLQAALDAFLKKSGFLKNQARQLADLLYGYFRFQLRTYFILKNFLINPQKLPSDFILLLGLALTSMLTQHSKPQYAIISCTVELIKELFGQRLGGVANAVLRNAQANLAKLTEKDWYLNGQSGSKLEHYAYFYSLPAQVIRLWEKSFGKEAALKLAERSGHRPWKGVRINNWHPEAKKIKDYFLDQLSPHIQQIGDWGIAIAPGYSSIDISGKSLEQWAGEGALSFQAAGSLLVLEKLGIKNWREPIWDACAGVGGKSLALINNDCAIELVTDISPLRLTHFYQNWPENLKKKPAFALMDASRPAMHSWSGNIIADVPCSGLGVLARRPELRLFSDNLNVRLQNFRNLQRKILAKLVQLLAPGHRLAYITCTLNPDENERNLEHILKSRSDLYLESTWQTPFEHEWLEGMFGGVLGKR